jgi:NAD(P)-dependent dehydrogenase (short-subunit alcohol dehydrogenase family)
MTLEDFQKVIDTNLTGLFNVTKSFLDKDLFSTDSGRNRIINMASVVALYGNFGQTNYVASKAGVIGMTKTWAKELGRKGFTANAIAPGFIETPMTAKNARRCFARTRGKSSGATYGSTRGHLSKLACSWPLKLLAILMVPSLVSTAE